MNILVQGALRYRLFYPVPKARAFGTTSGVPVTITGTKGQFETVALAVFLVVMGSHQALLTERIHSVPSKFRGLPSGP